ncbi:MAG: radical SAM protein [Candidatus Heimdallarchaeota archaeon]|nr:radical SAM protein [Candidatus Heimdallarchaeota archaeon]
MTTPPSLMRWISNNPIELKSINQSPIPYDVKIKLTFRCNAECYYCLHGLRTRTSPHTIKKLELSTFEWKQIISELYELGTRVITFSGGEPTIRSDLIDLVRYTSKLGIRVKMTSNGSLITKDLAFELAKNRLKTINISLDGIHDVHDSVRGSGMFDRTMKAIEFLGAAAREYGRPQIRVNHVITSQNTQYLEEFLNYLNEFPQISAIHLLFIDFKHNSSELALSKQDVKSILDQFSNISEKISINIRENNMLLDLDLMDNSFHLGQYAPESLRIPCYFPSLHMFILPNGDVNVCCGAERSETLLLGNIRDTPAMELWSGSRYRNIREYLQGSKKFPFCSACDHGLPINKAVHTQIME